MFLSFFPSPIGKITLLSDEDFLLIADFFDNKTEEEIRVMLEEKFHAPLLLEKNDVLREAEKQLHEYFLGSRKEFSLPLALPGTIFQRKAWEGLREIPYAETRTYKQQASSSGNPRASRAVGGANHRNPILIIVPCHRVIASDGGLGGYRGGIDRKKWLLDHERGFSM